MSTNRRLHSSELIGPTEEESLLEDMYDLTKIQEQEFRTLINRNLLLFKLLFLEEAFSKYFDKNCYKTHIEIWIILLIEIANAIIGSFYIGFNYSLISKSMLISFIICKVFAFFLEFFTIFHKKIKFFDLFVDYSLFLAICLGNSGICHLQNFKQITELSGILGFTEFGIGVQYIFAIHIRSKHFIKSLIPFSVSYLLFSIASNIDMIMPNTSRYTLIKFIAILAFGGASIIFMYNVHLNKRKQFFYQYLLLVDLRNQKAILDNVPIPLIISNECTIPYFNSAFSEMLKITSLDSFEGKCNAILCHKKNNAEKQSFTDFLKQKIDNKNKSNFIIEIDSNEYNMEITKIPIKYKGISSVISAFRDLTELLKEEKAKLQKKFELLIIGSMTHNFRTPLNCILATTEIVINLIDETNITLRNYLLKINQQALMLFDQVDSIHEYFNFKNGKLIRKQEIFSPKEVVSSIFDLYKDEFEEKKIKANCKLENISLPQFKNDKNKYRQIIISLITNSIKFTQNGIISISLNYSVQEKTLFTCIEDTGVGMTLEKMNQVKAFTSKIDMAQNDEYENIGLGIGIPLSNSLCKIMGGGQLDISSQKNYGTKVSFTILNCVERSNSIYQVNEEDSKSIPIVSSDRVIGSIYSGLSSPIKIIVKPQKLLFVDDVESNLFVLKAYAKKANVDYDIAHNGLEAYELYMKSSEKESEYNYSMIFMDINMPVMDGLEATRKIREYEKSILGKVRIIGITANMESTIESAGIEAGMNLVKFKPISYEAFEIILDSDK